MSIKLPINGKWSQTNNSDKFGSIYASRNIDLDEEGYIKLAPRSVMVVDEDDNADFGVPVHIGRFASGEYLVATASDAVFNVTFLPTTTLGADENSGTNEPTLTINSHGCFFKNLYHVTSAGSLHHRAISTDHTATWTNASGGPSLTSGYRHHMVVFESRQSICITEKNTVVQYTESGGSYTASTTLTLPADFEAIGLAYNNQRVGVITRLGSSTAGQDKEAYFFVWDGASTAANASAGVGSDQCLGVCAYKGSFVVLNRAGQLLYWNGGGFDVLASFPFWFSNKVLGGGSVSFTNNMVMGTIMESQGDVIYIHMPNVLDPYGRKNEGVIPNMPHGVWCFDPRIGLYHRYSGSISPVYINEVTSGNVNTTTNVLTISSGTIPATGGIARVTEGATGAGGFTLYQDYFIIKVSATTFKLATSKANAVAGTAIDITAAPSDTTTFHMYDLIDYGQGLSILQTGAIASIDETLISSTDFMIGGEYYNTALASKDSLCVNVPYLDGRGYFVTPKIYSDQVTETPQSLVVKFRPLKSGDQIVVKYRNREIIGLPTVSYGSAASAKAATWGNARSFGTSQDLSEAVTYFDAGGALELELIAGTGSGQMAQISDIYAQGSGYAVSVEDDILGASNGLKSEYIINNWEVKRTITSSDSDALNNYVVVPLGGSASWMQFKIELRGSDVTIEELQLISSVDQQAV